MLSKCDDPALQERLLERERRSESLAVEHYRHLNACENCRTSLERARRLALTWRGLAPTSAETAVALARFSPRRRVWPSLRFSSKSTALALVLAVAGAAAATRVAPIGKTWRSFASMPFASYRAAKSAPGGNAHQAPSPSRPSAAPDPGDVSASPDPAVAQPIREEAVEVLPASPAAKERHSASLVPRRATSPRPEGEPREVSPPPAPPELPGVANGHPLGSSRVWLHAASAMRAGNYAQAERAFSALAASADAPTRDAARLARAQIWIAEGRSAQARSELEVLSASGATAYIRSRAREALSTISR